MTTSLSTAFAGKRVLVAEDIYLIADDIRSALADAGATVVGPVSTLADAMLALPFGCDAAVIDVRLDDGEAYALADALADRSIPFVFVSGVPQASLPPRLAGVPFLCKPFTLDALDTHLAGLLAPQNPRNSTTSPSGARSA